jgi:hypothetical protein
MMEEAAEKLTKRAEQRYLWKEARYYLWVWRQKLKGKSMLTADLSYLRLGIMRSRQAIEDKKGDELHRTSEAVFVNFVEDDYIPEWDNRRKRPSFDIPLTSVPYLMFVGFLN